MWRAIRARVSQGRDARAAKRLTMGTDSLDGVTAARLVALTGVHESTARRWKVRLRCPRWLDRLLALCISGELGEVRDAWAGWRLTDGHLVSPEGWCFSPGEIRSIPFLHGQVRIYRSELENLRGRTFQADWIERRWTVLPEDR